ncbi:D-alanyl-D-alanine carboxypeptidase [Streptomyces sp. VRA16 Mangrove soil]|uniref:D-alanyl-D-alanine carboxypeptidase n=1 Tax=Streptomyces sp. VRA16 Mangrove soil TaxID=2817434 RepID=UPI0027DC5130|nr:D-alanyl-D-alanine carboxypeptidase [Streptomyces sp. VRA16 Mangrove soil]
MEPTASAAAAAGAAGSAAAKPADAELSGPKPVDGDSATAKPVDGDTAGAKPTGGDSVTEKPTGGDAAGAKSAGADASGAQPATGSKPADRTPSDAKPTGSRPSWAEPADSEPAAADPKPAGTEPGAVSPTDPKPAGTDPKPAGTDSKSDGTDPKSAAADPKPDGAKPAPAVDQPTAVFKAVKPPVDQPTTMLKSPAAAAGKGRAAESEAERTSKFVPLKPLDQSKPAAAATPEAVVGPKPQAPAEAERTRQQPLPPKPPLDLLAELTNTPPPPETRVRTTVRRVKIWTPLVLLLIVVFAIVQAVRPLPTPTLSLTAQETVSFDGDKPSVPWPGQGQAAMDVNGIGTFGTSGAQKPVPIASIAKVMTVYVILKDHPLKTGDKGPQITVDAAAQKHYETGKAENESVVKVTAGQKITEYEALQAVMLPSANNIAKLLARWDTGSASEDTFVAKMNKTAGELGMKNTTYTDPSGLDKTTVSTAEDLVKLGRAAMENPVFAAIAQQPRYVDLNGDAQKNFLGLVPTVAVGIKTGTTTAAGGNILFAAQKTVNGKKQMIIGAALGQYGQNGVANIDEVTAVVKRLIESGQNALKAKTIVKKGDVVGKVDDGLGGTTPVVATKDVSAVGWSGLTVRLALDTEKGKTVPHSAKAGTTVGVLSVGDGKNDAVEVPVALQKDLTEPGFGAKIKRVG